MLRFSTLLGTLMLAALLLSGSAIQLADWLDCFNDELVELNETTSEQEEESKEETEIDEFIHFMIAQMGQTKATGCGFHDLSASLKSISIEITVPPPEVG